MYDNNAIQNFRSAKNVLDPYLPYHFIHEQEPDVNGKLCEVNTIFLTSRECAFKCLMCDLWKNTLNTPTPSGAIAHQIDYALARLPAAGIIKLYNNGNFFDPKAIPPSDYPDIIERLKTYGKIVVENHPNLINKHCIAFNKKFEGKLEIAMGLETIHPHVLPKLNKQLTTEDFKRAAAFLKTNGIEIRAFVLLNPPGITDREENIHWTIKTVEFAFQHGVDRCSIIPVRPGNGIMDILYKEGEYIPPTLDMLEEVFEQSLNMRAGQVFVDTWDISFLSTCPLCFQERKQRLETMNLHQKIYQKNTCSCNTYYV